jgi:hypothetical protein
MKQFHVIGEYVCGPLFKGTHVYFLISFYYFVGIIVLIFEILLRYFHTVYNLHHCALIMLDLYSFNILKSLLFLIDL